MSTASLALREETANISPCCNDHRLRHCMTLRAVISWIDQSKQKLDKYDFFFADGVLPRPREIQG